MSGEGSAQLVIALLGFALVAGACGWLRTWGAIWPPVSAALLATAAVVASVSAELVLGRVGMTVLVATAGVLAVVGGGPVTTRIFTVVDRSQDSGPGTDDESIHQAGAVLRGGAWIGALERLAVFAGLSAGFPEGVAVVLALKGVGRFPDLRADEKGTGAATERFIIGTFSSVLWAAACAGMVALVRG